MFVSNSFCCEGKSLTDTANVRKSLFDNNSAFGSGNKENKVQISVSNLFDLKFSVIIWRDTKNLRYTRKTKKLGLCGHLRGCGLREEVGGKLIGQCVLERSLLLILFININFMATGIVSESQKSCAVGRFGEVVDPVDNKLKERKGKKRMQ